MQTMPTYQELMRLGPQTPEEQAEVWLQAANAFSLRVRKHNKRRVRIIRSRTRMMTEAAHG
jgi:hypothetical protein